MRRNEAVQQLAQYRAALNADTTQDRRAALTEIRHLRQRIVREDGVMAWRSIDEAAQQRAREREGGDDGE